jgi:TatD DNase family protein
MIRSERGKRLIAILPKERVLTETDGPFVRIGGRVCGPEDVAVVERELAGLWGVSPMSARARIHENFLGLVRKASIR